MNRGCKKIGKKKETLDNKIYSTFLFEFVIPNLKKQFGTDVDSKLVWQDDGDKKQRTPLALMTVSNFFDERIYVEEQSAKMAHVWPSENVWAILRQKKLKNKIIQEWKNFTPELCNRLMSSIGKRLQAVVKKNGDQVAKKDYE